jgi:quinoprotein dehydrogenase-associated probable ABC transporter substrate-binding protein
MFLHCRKLAVLFLAAMPVFAKPMLRVCADPNNLPFSNEQQQGFENKLAELVATSMGEKVKYTWWSQRKNFAKRSLQEGTCDVVMGVPSGLQGVLTSEPYYRSTYVFVSRRDRNLQIESIADPRLSGLRIGIHVVGDDFAPPAYALAHRGITQQIVAFSLLGSFGETNPPRKLIDAVANNEVDLAIAWGPFAGYFSQEEKAALAIAPVEPAVFMGVPFAYSIAAGVRPGNERLKTELDRILEAKSAAVQQILRSYDVPQVH